MRQVQDVIDQVIRAVQFVFLFALGAGVLVLYAALLADPGRARAGGGGDARAGRAAPQVLAAQRAEFAVLGLVAGVLAAVGATAIGYADRAEGVPVSVPDQPLGLAGGPAAWTGLRGRRHLRAAARRRAQHAAAARRCAIA